MHFPIIVIEKLDTPIEDWVLSLDYEDRCLLEHTDYYGDMYLPEDRKAVIESDWLKNLFDGIATVNPNAETITFLDEKTICHTIREWFVNEAEHLSHMAKAGRVSAFDFRYAGEHWRDFFTLFYNCTESEYGQTSMDFIENSVYLAGQTVRIGNIFDAHF